jgi:hypothetical protein
MIDTRHVLKCGMSGNFNQKYVKTKRTTIIMCLYLQFLLYVFFITTKRYRTIILCNVLYGSLSLREKRRVSVFEDRELRRTFFLKRVKVSEE